MVDKATWSPVCVQKDDSIMFLTVLFVGKLYLLNVKPPEGSGVSGSTEATAINLLFLTSHLLMW